MLFQKPRARVGSETESEDSDWTVKTSYTVLRDEAVPCVEDVYIYPP